MKTDSHGGNIYKKAKALGISESDILDFSANISPLGLPEHIKEAMIEAIDGTIHYPDPECVDLREVICRQDGVLMETLTCGNGGADLLYRLSFGLKPGKVLLPVPAFVEYEEAMVAAGASMVYYSMGEDLEIHEDFLDYITEDIDLLIICNPNNPTGLLTDRDFLLRVIEKAQEKDVLVMIDECFLEISRKEADYSVIPYTEGSLSEGRKFKNLIILKSFTKLYAIPGIRLGYMIGPKEVIQKVNRAGQAWSVSTIAQKAGLAALSKPAYKEAVLFEVEKELKFMKEELRKLPIRLYEGNVNYLFFRASGMTDLDKKLEEEGILIRNCSNYVNLSNDYWRVAVRNHEENVRLIRALRNIFI